MDSGGGNAKRRYFGLLAFLYEQDSEKFARFEGYSRGKRVHISKDPRVIEASGNSTQPEQIGRTPFYAVTNLPNALKRTIIADLMRPYGFPKEDIDAACAGLGDKE